MSLCCSMPLPSGVVHREKRIGPSRDTFATPYNGLHKSGKGDLILIVS